MKLFLDANVLFTAAHNPNGKASLLIELGGQGLWSLATSEYAIEEARRNLARKFPQSVERLETLLHPFEVVSHLPVLVAPPTLPDKDRPIFQAAMVCHATHLLTGDLKDFGPLMDCREKTSGILIQTIGAFLDSLGG